MKKAPVILFVIAFVGFAVGLVHLFHLRFEGGDNYPPYSSLRADPLGTKALYESFEPLVETRRHLHSLSKLTDGRDTTLLWLGAEPRTLRFVTADYQRIETFVAAADASSSAWLPSRARHASTGSPPVDLLDDVRLPPRPTHRRSSRKEFLNPESISIRDRWNVAILHAPLAVTEDGRVIPESAELRDHTQTVTLPRSLPIHTATHFANSDPSWKTLYTRVTPTNDYPVVIERKMGRGSIVLCADSYHFSNEALRREREPSLLAWYVGGARLFDETHLGVSREPGIAALAREYRLGGIFVALLTLAGFHLAELRELHAGLRRGACEGARRNCRGQGVRQWFHQPAQKRNIPPADLMKVCLEQWNAHGPGSRKNVHGETGRDANAHRRGEPADPAETQSRAAVSGLL